MERLIISETTCMCSGVCCPIKEKCYRFRLSTFFDVIARIPHPNPLFVDPSFDASKQSCHFFLNNRTFTKDAKDA